MMRKVLVIITAAAVISVFCLSGCKKRPSKPEPGEEPIKTLEEYKAEAEKEITGKNLEEELERLEKEIEAEIREEQESAGSR
ncbi:MAG: hypothetical protein ACYSTG_06200 [Planctomycetota bacterium]|jgi:hypothetical protein